MPLNRIIVSRTDSIGDVMLTLPMLGVIKKHYPQTKIIFLGSNYTQAIAKACKNIDSFINWSELQKQSVAEQIKVLNADAFPEWINHLYHYAWFVGFGVSGFVYLLLMKNKK